MSDSRIPHGALTEPGVSGSPTTHPRKGREGNREGKTWSPIHEPHGPARDAEPVDNPTADTGQGMDAEHADQPLFGGYEPPRAAQLSPDQRRTRRQAADIAAGRHPLTRHPLHPAADATRTATSPQDGTPTCGTCQFRGLIGHHAKAYPKCQRPGAVITHGAASDVRAWWPACGSWVPKASA